MSKSAPSKNINGFSAIFVLAFVVVLALLSFGAYTFFGKGIKLGDLTLKPIHTNKSPTQNKLANEDLIKKIKDSYNGSIPWNSLSSRKAYEFFPKQIGSFPLELNGRISENFLRGFVRPTTFDYTNKDKIKVSIPLSNS
jgi:hypothetical protein